MASSKSSIRPKPLIFGPKPKLADTVTDIETTFHREYQVTNSTGWISDVWKKVQANILKDPLVLLKQTIPQQKALDLSFNLAPCGMYKHSEVHIKDFNVFQFFIHQQMDVFCLILHTKIHFYKSK